MYVIATTHTTDMKWLAAGITFVLVLLVGGVLSPFFYRRRAGKLARERDSTPEADRPALDKRIADLRAHTGVRQALGLLFGADERLSTSKAMAVAWTILVAYVLIVLLLLVDFDGWDDALKNLWPTYALLLGGPYA